VDARTLEHHQVGALVDLAAPLLVHGLKGLDQALGELLRLHVRTRLEHDHLRATAAELVGRDGATGSRSDHDRVGFELEAPIRDVRRLLDPQDRERWDGVGRWLRHGDSLAFATATGIGAFPRLKIFASSDTGP